MERKLSINDIAAYLDEIGLQYMATIGLDGKPKVRPVQYMILRDDKLWFCTNSEKAMYAELQKSPFIDLCGSRLQKDEITTALIRFSAEVVFPVESEEIRGIKKAIMQKSKLVRELYNNNQEHPLFKVFYLKNICGSVNNLGHVKGLEERNDFSRPIEFSFKECLF
ncbi:pyridoxamine 5'-phosphate oxidase family protein [Treponema denticola]|uniref:pyridoxamine 5'-phosphate oxidase family protein n=1 Tax=Treponema denticola TaxID=158 RepID=UPI0020A293AF|nr:pyridoxamine 5'-phosphate oxidase family protein [Treponema denticola]UTD13164.1 pyridoxamine 5'-phosphate oxidase family protein [Treponema denticola]